MAPRLSQSAPGTPHSVSLKVLRLSRPSQCPSAPLPSIPSHPALQKASLPHPSASTSPFPLTELLTLPPSFGAAYVGETFSCALSANNEAGGTSDISVQDVRIGAELQTPSSTTEGGVELAVSMTGDDDGAGTAGGAAGTTDLVAGASVQGIIRHDLKEEGPHVLVVTVHYLESTTTTPEVHGHAQPRPRLFRKLYQFAAQQAVGVRTKIGEVRSPATSGGRAFAVEAQVENLTGDQVVVEAVRLEAVEGVACLDLNGAGERRWLGPGDVEQVAFRLEVGDEKGLREEAGRWVLAQLVVDWRMAMGQGGTLRTGWLGCLRRD